MTGARDGEIQRSSRSSSTFSAHKAITGTTMNRLTTLALGTMALLFLGAASPNVAVPQLPAKTVRQQLVGTWAFVRTEATQADGKTILPFGPHPTGANIFTEDGHFAQIQIADGIPKFASNSRV